MEAWQQFILQALAILVPVAIAYLRLNGRIKRMEIEKAACMKKLAELETKLTSLSADHAALQAEYNANLKAQAGMRDKF